MRASSERVERDWRRQAKRQIGIPGRYVGGYGGLAKECWKGDGTSLSEESWAVSGLSSSSARLR